MKKIVQLGCGSNFTIMLDSKNQLFSFGDNSYGQLGYQTEDQTNQVRNIKLNRKI